MARKVTCRETIPAAASSAVNRMMEATLENTRTKPSAMVPQTAPPEVTAVPVTQNCLRVPAEAGNSTLHSTIWHSAPSSTGSSSVQVTRSCTGRP